MSLKEITSKVMTALTDDITYAIAKSYTRKSDVVELTTDIIEGYSYASEELTFGHLSVEEYLMNQLKAANLTRKWNFYDSESVANNDGYYWFDECDLWIKLYS